MLLAAFKNQAEPSHYKITLQDGSWRQEYSFDVEEVDLNGQKVLVGQWDERFEQDFLERARLRRRINQVVLKRLHGGFDTLPIDINESANDETPMADSQSFEDVLALVRKYSLLDVLNGVREVMETDQATTFDEARREYVQRLIERLQNL